MQVKETFVYVFSAPFVAAAADENNQYGCFDGSTKMFGFPDRSRSWLLKHRQQSRGTSLL
jgi:hypothetical protein